MIQPVEMRRTLPMTLHGGARSTTTEVWDMLSACRDGDSQRVAALLAHRPELATCQFNYTPPLHFAVREGHLAIVRMLIERQALDPEYKSYPFGHSFLAMAEDRGHEEVAQLLRETLSRPESIRKWPETGEIDYGQSEEERLFDRAVQAGRYRDVERMLERTPHLARNELSCWAEGVLMMPAKKGHRTLLDLLIRFGAQVPALSKWGRFYYFWDTGTAAFLLERGMTPRHMTWLQVTLLHDMAQSGELAKARLLLEAGADIEAIDDEHRSTPLGLAARWGQLKLVELLLDRGADPNRGGAVWATPLAWARKRGHDDVVRRLVAAGAVA